MPAAGAERVKLRDEGSGRNNKEIRSKNAKHFGPGNCLAAVVGISCITPIAPVDEIRIDSLPLRIAVIGDVQNGLSEFSELLTLTGELDPDDASPHYNLGNVYRALGDYEQAIAALRLAKEALLGDARSA